MPYYNNFTQFYPSAQPQYVPQQQTQSNHLIWVQGENSAKSYPVAAGQSVPLFDSENPVFYIKGADQSGMPLPLRIFDYKERTQERTEMRSQTVAEQKIDYISRKEFDAFRDEIRAELKQPTSTTSKATSKTVQNKKEE